MRTHCIAVVFATAVVIALPPDSAKRLQTERSGPTRVSHVILMNPAPASTEDFRLLRVHGLLSEHAGDGAAGLIAGGRQSY